MAEKIETLIKKLEKIARLTERNTFDKADERKLNNIVSFEGMTTYQQSGVCGMIENFKKKTGIDLNFWIDENTDNNFDLIIKF